MGTLLQMFTNVVLGTLLRGVNRPPKQIYCGQPTNVSIKNKSSDPFSSLIYKTTTLRRNSQNELKPGASAPGAGAPALLLGEVAPGAGASRDSFPEIQSAKMASAAPGLHRLTAPALSNRPLYQSWGAEPLKIVHFVQRCTIFLWYLHKKCPKSASSCLYIR